MARHRRSLVGGLAACLVAVGVPVLSATDVEPASVDLGSGAAWLVSAVEGQIVRVNGSTARVDAQVDFGDALGSAVAHQVGDTVLVEVDGELRSLDVANLGWGASRAADGGLVVGEGATYLVGADGEVRHLDPMTLENLGTTQLDGTPGRGVVADERLVLPIDDGTVRVIDGDEQVGEIDVGDADDVLHVTAAGRSAVVLNQSAGSVYRVDVRRARAASHHSTELPRGELLVPTELPQGPLFAFAVRTGELVRVEPRTGATEQTVVASPGADVVGPAAAGNQVYLVDRSTRELIQLNRRSLEEVQRVPLELDDASGVELIAEGGYIFVNDVNGSMVIVVKGDNVRRLDKYDDDPVPGDSPAVVPVDVPGEAPPDPGQPAPPGTDPPAPPNQVTAVAGNASASVSWDHGVGTTPPTAYHVSYDGSPPIDLPGGTTSVNIDGLRNGQTYVFDVWASNEYGESAVVASNAVEPNDEVPGAPGSVTATAGNASAEVSWDGADGRGNDIASYIVTASPGGQTATVGGGSTTTMVTGLPNDVAYTFTVTAVNELGIQGTSSAPSNAVTPYGPPSALAGLTAEQGDESVSLAWNASTSRTPVTYVVSVNPAVGGRSQWETTGTSWSGSGFTNGVEYTLTVTPVNDRGAGTSATARVNPGRAPTVSNASASLSGDRSFEVTFNFDLGGRAIDGCWVSVSGSDATVDADCDASSGTGSATFDVATYWTNYTFTAHVETSLGEGSAAAAAQRSAAKPYTVRSDGSAFDGTCTWADWGEGTPNTRPYWTSANHTCPAENPGPAGYIPLGTALRGECHTQGEEVTDDNLVATTTWIRISGYGYMPTIYFTNYQDNPTANLPAC